MSSSSSLFVIVAIFLFVDISTFFIYMHFEQELCPVVLIGDSLTIELCDAVTLWHHHSGYSADSPEMF